MESDVFNVVSLRKEPSIAQWWSVSCVCKVRALWSSRFLNQSNLHWICASASMPLFFPCFGNTQIVVLDLWLYLSPSLVNIAPAGKYFFIYFSLLFKSQNLFLIEGKLNFPFPYLYYIICHKSGFYNECVVLFKRKCGCEVLPHRSKGHLWEWLVIKLSNPVGHIMFYLRKEFSSNHSHMPGDKWKYFGVRAGETEEARCKYLFES